MSSAQYRGKGRKGEISALACAFKTKFNILPYLQAWELPVWLFKRRLLAMTIESTFNTYWLADALMKAGFEADW